MVYTSSQYTIPFKNYQSILYKYNTQLNYYFNKHITNQKNSLMDSKVHPIIQANIVNNGKYLSFNSKQREILYAIQDCFSKRCHSEYKETPWDKSLFIPLVDIPPNPPFENIMQYYEKHFLDRLTLIDINIEQKKNKHVKRLDLNSVKSIILLIPERINDLKKRKKEIYKTNFAYNVFYIDLPQDILKMIFKYLYVINYKKSNKLRKAYENIRADINTAMLL